MKKQQQIRSVLKKDSDPREYRFYIGEHEIQDRTWASVQKWAKTEVLNIWMKTPKPPIPKVSVKGADSDSDTGSQIKDMDEESEAEDHSMSGQGTNFKRLDPVPLTSAFLAWRILDEFGEQDESSPTIKTNRFLNAIYQALPAICKGDTAELSTTASRAQHAANITSNARPKISIEGKTLLEIDDLIHGTVSRTPMQGPSTEHKLRWEYSKLFNFFVPDELDRKFAPIQLFWGAVYELVVRPHHIPWSSLKG